MKEFFGAVCGLAIALGSLAAWHYWNMDGLFSLLIGCGGLTVLCKSLGIKFSF